MKILDIVQIGIAVLGGIGGILIMAGFIVKWVQHGKHND